MLIVLAVVIGLNSCAVTVDEMSTLKSHALSDMRKELEGRDVSILYESPQVTILSKQNLSGGVRKFRLTYATPSYTANVTANVNRHDTIRSNSLTLETLTPKEATPSATTVADAPVVSTAQTTQDTNYSAIRQSVTQFAQLEADERIRREHARIAAEFRQKVNLLQSEVATIRWQIRKELSDLNRHIIEAQNAIRLASGRIAGLTDAEIARFDFTPTHVIAMRHQHVFREMLLYMARHAPTDIFERYQLIGERIGMPFTREEAEDYRYPLLQQFPERFPLETEDDK